MRKLNLDILNEGQKGLTPKVAGFYLEALVYCLMSNGHFSGTRSFRNFIKNANQYDKCKNEEKDKTSRSKRE